MKNIARIIDHSLLRPDAAEADIIKLCDEAGEHGFNAVCVPPSFIGIARQALFETHVKISTVIGFPLGNTLSRVKIYEAIESVMSGADELDIVMNISQAKSGNWQVVEKEIADIVTATPAVVHKIILETCYLTDDEKKKACSVVMASGAEYIKTSTGFGTAGARIEDIELIKAITKNQLGIKAAGGIKSLKDVTACVNAGATRIGTSAGVDIMRELAASG